MEARERRVLQAPREDKENLEALAIRERRVLLVREVKLH